MTTATSTASSLARPSARVAFNRLRWVGPLTIVVAVAATVVIQQAAATLVHPDPRFMPLTLIMPAALTFGMGLGAVAVYTLIGRYARQPIQLFRRIAAGALVVTFIPDVALSILKFYPGTTTATVTALVLMHLAAWAIMVGLLTGLARADQQRA